MNEKTSSKADTRQERIRKMLLSHNVVSITEFCQQLDCSESTIRNDLKSLDEQGIIKRTYGGAVLNENTRYNIAMNTRYELYKEQKEAIASYIIQHYLKDEAIITLDSGTTMVAIAKKILESSLKLTVITSSLAIAEVLNRTANIDLYLTGGKLNHIKEAFIDQSAVEFISSMSSDLCLLSCDGVDAHKGITIGDPEEVTIKKAMINNSKRSICVADGSKIGLVKLKEIFPLSKVKSLITDSNADKGQLEAMRNAGIEVQVVD